METVNHPSQLPAEMRLYDRHTQRLYINAEERHRFVAAAGREVPTIRAFALTLLYTGCRLSEARELTRASFQLPARQVSIRSQKKRQVCHMRELPIPSELVDAIEAMPISTSGFLWEQGGGMLPRITAYRWIKRLMTAAAIDGPQATAKGLRHGYGVHAIRSGVPVTLLQRWMGHSSLSTTAIYTHVLGAEELEIADWMW